MADEYFYHSFPRPRRADEDLDAKGLAILESILESGLLLVPEFVRWPGELLDDGRVSEGATSIAKRVCLTHLKPREVICHANKFGPFALEFDDDGLRFLGGNPVFYIPVSEKPDGLQLLPLHFMHRLTDIHLLLERLIGFKTAFLAANAAAQILVGPTSSGGLMIGTADAQNGVVFSKEWVDRMRGKVPIPSAPIQLEASAGAVSSLVNVLSWNIQPFQMQLDSLRAMSGLFYPCERSADDEQLSYYRQREWRILANVVRHGEDVTRKLSETEVDRLLRIDSDFFGKEFDFPTGRARRVDQCQYLTHVAGKHVMQLVRRFVCPHRMVAAVRATVETAGYGSTPIVPLEELASGCATFYSP